MHMMHGCWVWVCFRRDTPERSQCSQCLVALMLKVLDQSQLMIMMRGCGFSGMPEQSQLMLIMLGWGWISVRCPFRWLEG